MSASHSRICNRIFQLKNHAEFSKILRHSLRKLTTIVSLWCPTKSSSQTYVLLSTFGANLSHHEPNLSHSPHRMLIFYKFYFLAIIDYQKHKKFETGGTIEQANNTLINQRTYIQCAINFLHSHTHSILQIRLQDHNCLNNVFRSSAEP